MEPVDGRCGPLYRLYITAREGDETALRRCWADVGDSLRSLDEIPVNQLEEGIHRGDVQLVRELTAGQLFQSASPPTLQGRIAVLLGTLLYAFGYMASFVLFFQARSREAVVRRLRWAYRTVGVDIRDTETVGGVERTTFRCPYRNLGADRYGTRHACHDVLDRVDDGYVTWLARHRGIDYQRPRACTASECCYSEVAEL